MKGVISGIKRMEIHDGDGLRTTVFFKGCPLRCLWCHNPESLFFAKQVAFFAQKCAHCGACGGEKSERTEKICPTGALEIFGREYGAEELLEEVLEDEPFFKNGGGVTLSGGECLAQPEFATAFAKALFERGISVYVDTCGYVRREVLEAILPYALSFAAGAMILVAVHELIPECQQNQKVQPYFATMGIVLGFAAMMLLDVMLG